MNKIKINAQVLVALISLSLAGIIGLQAYLFRGAIMVRDARFKEEAARALDRVGRRLEAMEAQRFLTEQVETTNQFFKEQQLLFNDSVLHALEQEQMIGDSIYWRNQLYNQPGFSVNLDTDGVNTQFDKQIIMRAAEQQENYRKYVTMRLRRIDTLFRQMIMQSMGNFVPFEGRFSKAEIDSVLHAELNQRGLNLNYEFAVVEDGYITPLKSAGFNKANIDFKVPLYKNDFFSGPKWLLISFPERISFLLQSMWYMLALSGLFTTLIIVAFGYTVNQMQKQKKISQIKSDFINNMTHEFKTPIATINLAVDALSNPKVALNQDRINHYRRVIKDENTRMHAQVEKVLQLAMLDKQELELRKKNINLHDLIQHSINHLSLQIEARNGLVLTHFNAQNHHVVGDEIHLGNVFVNVLDNAIKYSKNTLKIEVTSRNENNMIVIDVKDNGMGMSKEVQRKVFNRFYRQTGGNIHDVKGHGLGLSYVSEIVEMHNGTIDVDSTLGRGTIFTISIPLNPKHDE